MTRAAVLIETADAVMTVTINRPEARNAINRAVSDGIADALQAADADDGVRVIVLTGAGGTFCAGADLKEVMHGREVYDIDGANGLWGLGGITERTTRKPIIAAVEGHAFGGGFEVALACDIVIADPAASFALPEVKVGLIAAAGGIIRLAEQAPLKLALDWLLTGDPIDAATAHRYGVISRISQPGEARAEAGALARRIAANAPLSVVATKQLARNLVDGGDETLADGWRRNHATFREIRAHADAREGAAAFAERRTPVWTGR